jgi:hypothetical protein
MFSVTTGSYNTAVGAGALDLNTADSNTATGAAALLFNTKGAENTANGTAALEFNETGSTNTASGAFALFSNTVGSQNTAVGDSTLFRSTDGTDNTAIGFQALYNNRPFNPPLSGQSNTAIGSQALFNNAIGSNNTANGYQALYHNTTGNDNTALGYLAGNKVTTANNVICIGFNVPGENVDNTCYIGNIFNQASSGGSAVFVNGLGKLGTVTSSKRFKEEIKPIGTTSEALFSLKPVAFHYKKEIDPAGTPQLGLVAEEVEKVNPDLVIRDKEGKPYTVRYDQVNAMLLNEFLKEHRKVEQQRKDFEAALAQQQKQIEALTEAYRR